MVIKKTEVVKILEGIAERLDEAVTDTPVIDIDEEAGYRDIDYDIDINNDTDRIESALINAENRMDEIKQVLNEEIDYIRSLVEVLE